MCAGIYKGGRMGAAWDGLASFKKKIK